MRKGAIRKAKGRGKVDKAESFGGRKWGGAGGKMKEWGDESGERGETDGREVLFSESHFSESQTTVFRKPKSTAREANNLKIAN